MRIARCRVMFAVYLGFSVSLIGWMTVRPVVVAGDSWEYLLAMQSLWNHGSPDIRDGDFSDALELFPENHPDGRPQLCPGLPPYWQLANNGRPYPIHFCTMPVFALPAKAILRWSGGSELAAVPVTNVVWLTVAVGLALFTGCGPPRRRMLFVGLAAVNPIIWYLEYGGVEVFCWSLAMIGLVALDRSRFGWSAAAFGLAATQNPTLAALVLLPLIGAWRNGWPRVAIVVGIGGTLTAIPFLFFLWHFGQPSLLTRFTDPALISWGRTLSLLTDLNQGLLPYTPVLLVALPMALVAAVRRREWNCLLAFVATAAMIAVVQMQVNWNSDGRGMLRYLVWMLPPLAWIVARGLTGWLAWVVFGMAVFIHGAVLIFDQPIRWQYLEQRRIAAWILSEHPTWYNPDPEIFAERQSAREVNDINGFPVVSPWLPVLAGRTDGEVTKVLVDRFCVDRLAEKFLSIDLDTLAAMRSLAEKADKPTYYHPPRKSAWATPGTIHGWGRE